MARPPKPHNLKVIAGTDRPDRLVPTGVDLPLVDLAPLPPDWLPQGHAVREWERLSTLLAANRLLTEASLGPLAILCALHGTIVQHYQAGMVPTGHMLAQYRNLVNDFGMTPVAQGKVKPLGEESKANKFARNGAKAKGG